MRTSRLLAAGVFALAPFFAHASVSMSEVAWMGTAESSNGEWIELYNDGTDAVDLKGWKLYEAGGGTLVFAFTKEIAPGGFLVLERTTASVPDPLPGVGDESGAFGGGGLNNSGEHIVLKDSSGATVEDLDFSGGWPKGNASSKSTMQKSGGGWITASPTPKGPNATADLDADGEGPTPTATTTPPASGPASSHSSSAPLSNAEDQRFSILKGRDRLSSVGAPVEFSTRAVDRNGNEAFNVEVEWSMGDGTVERGSDVRHAYKFPGTYVVVVNAKRGSERSVSRMTIKVVDPEVSIVKAGKESIEILNSSAHEVNLEGWTLSDGSREFAFPRDTIVLPGSKIAFARSVLLLAGDTLTLANPAKLPVASSSPASSVAGQEKPPAAGLPGATVQAKPKAIIATNAKPHVPAPTPAALKKETPGTEAVQAVATTGPSAVSQSASVAEAVEIYREEGPPPMRDRVSRWLRSVFRRE